MITDGTISTATTSAFIIFTAAAFMVADFTAVVAFMAVAATGRDELLLIRKDRGSNLAPRSGEIFIAPGGALGTRSKKNAFSTEGARETAEGTMIVNPNQLCGNGRH